MWDDYEYDDWEEEEDDCEEDEEYDRDHDYEYPEWYYVVENLATGDIYRNEFIKWRPCETDVIKRVSTEYNVPAEDLRVITIGMM